MEGDDRARRRHMLDAAQLAQGFVQGRTQRDLDDDPMLVLALVKAVEIVGEALYQTSESTRSSLEVIPWSDIIAMRHRLVHDYTNINLDILWSTIQDDLPKLIPAIEGPRS